MVLKNGQNSSLGFAREGDTRVEMPCSVWISSLEGGTWQNTKTKRGLALFWSSKQRRERERERESHTIRGICLYKSIWCTKWTLGQNPFWIMYWVNIDCGTSQPENWSPSPEVGWIGSQSGWKDLSAGIQLLERVDLPNHRIELQSSKSGLKNHPPFPLPPLFVAFLCFREKLSI